MLISVKDAATRYATSRAAIVGALNARTLTRHEVDGKVVLDTDELDQLFDPVAMDAVEQPEQLRQQVPSINRPLPTPDELDAALARAVG